MKVIGSVTSPFVRRIRALLELRDIPFEFEALDTRSDAGRLRVGSLSNIRRVPLLEDEGNIIFDSLIIVEYILQKKDEIISIEDKLLLKLVDEISDSAVHLFQLKFHGDDTDWKTKFACNHLNRVDDCLSQIDQDISKYEDGNTVKSIWLYCLVDWLLFREVFEMSKYSNILNFYNSQSTRDIFVETDPRL